MHRVEQLMVNGHEMPMLVFEPRASGLHAGVIVAQHLLVAHAGLELDPFQIEVGERYAQAGYKVAMPFLFHWWPTAADISVKREKFRDDWTVTNLRVTLSRLSGQPDVHEDAIGLLGHCWVDASHGLVPALYQNSLPPRCFMEGE